MKTTLFLPYGLRPGVMLGLTGFLLFLFSCSPSAEERYSEQKEMNHLADSVSTDLLSGASALPQHDSSHIFLRTATIKFRVKDVKEATFRIEDIVRKYRGYVEYTHLSTDIRSESSVPISEDSLRKTNSFAVTNTFNIRVPNYQLDSSLRDMAALIDFLDYRTITANDVKDELYANMLAEKRFRKHSQRVETAIDQRGRKLPETTQEEDHLLVKQGLADQTRMDNRRLMEDVNYSTVKLDIYQKELVQTEILPIVKEVKPYEPGFLHKLGEACVDGWHILEAIVLFFLHIWSILLILLVLFLGFRRYVLKNT